MSSNFSIPLSALAAMALCAAADDVPAAAPAPEATAAEAPAAVAAPAAEAAAEAPAEDKVLVRINGVDAVMKSEVDELVTRFIKDNGSRIPPEQIVAIKRNMERDMAQNLVMQYLLKAEADKQGVAVTDADRTDALSKFGFPDKTAAMEAFGLSGEAFDKMFDTNIAIQKLLESQTNGIAAPTEEQVRAKFDEIVAKNPEAANRPESVTASHILVKVESGASEEEKAAAKEKIEKIRERALAGEDFAALAKENSDCPSKASGGDLGSFRRGQMVKPFEDAAFSQPVGEIGPVVETSFGFHVVKVTDRTEAGKVEFDDVKEILAANMTREAERTAVSEFMDKVHDAAKIEFVGAPEVPAVVSDAIEIPGGAVAPAPEEEAPATAPEAGGAE